MSLADLVGQMLQQGMAGQTHNRLQTFGGRAPAGGGMEQMLGALLGGAGAGGDLGALLGGLMGGQGGGTAAGANPLGGLLGGLLGGAQGGARGGSDPLSGMLGALLGGAGGATRSAAGGSAMAVLGTLAMTALQAYAQSSQTPAAAPEPARAPELLGAGAERLVARAMLAAARADGRLDQAELDRVVGKLSEGGLTPAEKAFVEAEMAGPADPAAVAAEATTPELAAQAYAASILAIDIDTDAERDYLRRLAAALRLPDGAVRQLHQMTGAPLP